MSSRANDLERLDGDNRANAEGGERMYEKVIDEISRRQDSD